MVNKPMSDAVSDALDALDIDDSNYRSYLRQIMMTAGKLQRDNASVLELKLITNSIKEMQYAFKIFDDYQDRKKISVFGSSRTHPEDPRYREAETFGRIAAEAGYMLISGGGPGIMEAINQGAGREHSFGLHINLPFEARPNPYIRDDRKCIHFRYFFSRKLIFAKETSAVVIFPGGFGTHDELFELLTLMQTGRQHMVPIVLVDRGDYWERFQEYLEDQLLPAGTISDTDRLLYDRVDRAKEALSLVDRFYSNYHSSRYVEDEFIIRFETLPDGEEEFLDEMEDRYDEICPETGFRVEKGPVPGEGGEVYPDMYRLIFSFSAHDHGLLRDLIRYINSVTFDDGNQ